MKRLIATLVLLAAFAVSALPPVRSFYIDFATGSDTDGGTNNTIPWQRHPYMVGFAGTYTHQAGDRFIFKGGVTWPSSCLRLNILLGGTSDGARDYYGVDYNYFSGGSWTRPCFDGEWVANQCLATDNSGPRFITIDGLELKRASVGQNTDGLLVFAFADNITVTNCYIHGWRSTDAVHDHYMGGIINCVSFVSGSSLTNYVITHCEIANDVPGEGDGNSGIGVFFPGELAFSKIHGAPQLQLHGGPLIHDCEFYNAVASFESGGHCNATYMSNLNGKDWPLHGPGFFYNNYIHDINTGAAEIGMATAEGPHDADGEIKVYAFNNLIISSHPSGQPPIAMDPAPVADGATGIFIDATPRLCPYIFNNTLISVVNGSACIQLGSIGRSSPAPPQKGVDVKRAWVTNNIFIGPTDIGWHSLDDHIGLNKSYATDAAANADGLYAASYYRPTHSISGVTDSGLDLSGLGIPALDSDGSVGGLFTPVTRTVWDIGAFEFAAANPDPMTTVTPGSLDFSYLRKDTTSNLTFTVQNTGTNTLNVVVATAAPFSAAAPALFVLTNMESTNIVVTYTPTSTNAYDTGSVTFTGGSNGVVTRTVQGRVYPVLTNWVFNATNMEHDAGYPLVVSNVDGTVYASGENTNPDLSGRLTAGFYVTNAGDYTLVAECYCVDQGHNSWFVNFDAAPTSPTMIWDVQPPLAGWIDRTVSWRGSGSDTNNEFAPKAWTLGTGYHTLYLRSREAGAMLRRLTLTGSAPGAAGENWVIFGKANVGVSSVKKQ